MMLCPAVFICKKGCKLPVNENLITFYDDVWVRFTLKHYFIVV